MASMASPLYGAVASSSYSHTGKGFLATTGGAPRVWRGGGVVAARRRRRCASHRRADRGSGRRGEDATLSLPSRMPSPTACRVTSLMTASS